MKELTIEEKAKRYDEALERAKKLYNDGNSQVATTVEEIFPELKESDDERIRKAIYNCVKWFGFDSCFFKDVSQEECFDWLEKQDEQKTTIEMKTPEESLGIDSDTYNKIVDDCVYGEQKPAEWHREEEQNLNACLGYIPDEFLRRWLMDVIHAKYDNPADKVEPKFKQGEWIVWQDKCYKVNYNGCGYELVDQNGLSTSLEYGTVDENAHLWIIKDAKPGDILFHSDSASNGIFIFKELLKYEFSEKVICYCDYDSEDHFCLGEHHTCCWADAKILHPATKEQREQLEKAMADADYTFDFEKKELKKIEED